MKCPDHEDNRECSFCNVSPAQPFEEMVQASVNQYLVQTLSIKPEMKIKLTEFEVYLVKCIREWAREKEYDHILHECNWLILEDSIIEPEVVQ